MVLTISSVFLSDGKTEFPCFFENGLYEQTLPKQGAGSMVTHRISALLTPDSTNTTAAESLAKFGCRIVLENGQKFKISPSETTADVKDDGIELKAEWISFGASFTL